MNSYAVGAPFPVPFPAQSPVNGSFFYFNKIGCELITRLESLTCKEIAAYQAGQRILFGLFKPGSVLFILFKFGDQPWCEAPFHMHIQGEFKGTVPEDYSPGWLLSVLVHLVDSAGNRNIVKRLRYTTFDAEFSRLLVEAVQAQISNPVSRFDYEREITRIYARYPTTESMVQEAQIISGGGK